MKKITSILIALLLVVAMVASLAACGSNDCGEGNHKWNTGEITKSATCTEDGTKVYTCTVCGATREETIPASHTYGPATSISDAQHQKECTVCHEDTVTDDHEFTYTPISGQQKHTKSCSECNFSKEEDCTIEDGKCTLCNANYSQDPTTPTEIKVHFHIPADWTADNVHAYAWNGMGDPLICAYPGAPVTAEEDGWCVVTFESEEQYANIQINFNDYVEEVKEVKTGDVVLVAAECYVPAIEGGTKSYATQAEALAAEEVKVPENAWFITGYFNGVVAWTDSTNDYDRVFQESNGYSLTSTFAATNDFKVKQNDGSWDNNVLGYDNLGEITSDVFEGNLKSLFTRGEDDKANNIVVNYVCELTITFDTANQKINIKILSAEGFNPDEGDEPEPTPTPTDGYVLVGEGNTARFGENGWEQLEQNKFLESDPDEANPNYYFYVSLKAGDQFKVRFWDDDEWAKGSFGIGNYYFEKADGLTATKEQLFTAGSDKEGNTNDNIKVLCDCTVYLTIYKNDLQHMKIYVESIEGTLPEPTPSDNTPVLVGSKWGTLWPDVETNKFAWNEQAQMFELNNVSLAKDDEFKIKFWGDDWTLGEVNYGTDREVTKADTVTGSVLGLFAVPSDGSNFKIAITSCVLNFSVKKDLSQLKIHIVSAEGLPENVETYEYVMYVYASGWTTMYLWAWEGPWITNVGSAPYFAMTSLGNGWFTTKITSTIEYGCSVKFNVTKSNNWSTEVKFGDPATVWSQKDMYFNINGVKRGTSPEAVGAPALPATTAVTPVQVATVPPQSAVKFKFAA